MASKAVSTSTDVIELSDFDPDQQQLPAKRYHSSTNTKRHLIIEARRDRVAYMLLCGLTEAAIAKELDVSPATITHDCQAVRDAWERDTIKNATQVAIRDVQRLDQIIELNMLKIGHPDPKISNRAADLMIKAIESKARILGYAGGGITIDIEEQLRKLAHDNDFDEDQAVEIARKFTLVVNR